MMVDYKLKVFRWQIKQTPWLLFLVPLFFLSCSKAPATTPAGCLSQNFPGSFQGGCLDTNLDGRCTASGDILLSQDGFFTAFGENKPQQQGTWRRSGNNILLEMQTGCNSQGFNRSCGRCGTTSEVWSLSYSSGFVLTKQENLALSVNCLLE